jgi:hypothetical protein
MSAEDRLRFRETCEEFFFRLEAEELRGSFLRSVCEPSLPWAFVSLCKLLVDGILACLCPTTCLCGLALLLCWGGVVEGESVWLWIELVDRWPPSSGLCADCACSDGILAVVLLVRLIHLQVILFCCCRLPNVEVASRRAALMMRWPPVI